MNEVCGKSVFCLTCAYGTGYIPRTMKLPSKSRNLVLILTLFFACTALVPYSHCSADENPLRYGESCGSDCRAKHGFPARHEHGTDLHEHDSSSADSLHLHFVLEGVSSAFRSRCAQDVVKIAKNSATVDSFSSPASRFAVSRGVDSPVIALTPQLQTIPTGLSPPC